MAMPELVLRTARLCLVAATLEHTDAELRDRAELQRLLGASVPEDWPPGEYDREAQEFFRSMMNSQGAALHGWLNWYVVTCSAEGAREALVAGAGFLGAPSDGVVEIGYSVVESARGRGFATEIVAALVAHAFRHEHVVEVVAHTSDANVASTRTLLRCGFARVGPGAEPQSVQYRIAKPRSPSASEFCDS